MSLSMSTDYTTGIHEMKGLADFFSGIGNPDQYLRRIAEAGFKHVHWCHHWRSDMFYAEPELVEIGKMLKKYDLSVVDIHGSEGIEKFWYSPAEYSRLAGVELVKNRLEFAARFGADAVVMHVYPLPEEPETAELVWNQLRKTLDALEPYCRLLGVKLAIENLVDWFGLSYGGKTLPEARDNREVLRRIFSEYPADTVGLCWDSGHANLGRNRNDILEMYSDRLCVTHLHDNDGTSDAHLTPFSATVDWEHTAQLIAASPYNKPLTYEIMQDERFETEEAFLTACMETAQRFAGMVAAYRDAP